MADLATEFDGNGVVPDFRNSMQSSSYFLVAVSTAKTTGFVKAIPRGTLEGASDEGYQAQEATRGLACQQRHRKHP